MRPQNAPSSGSKEAEESCRILEEYGIDLNSAANGVFLPYIKNNFVTTESMHSGGHSNMYHINSRLRLEKIETTALELDLHDDVIRNQLCKELKKIREELLTGQLRVHK